mgnify:CR=1 FL=1
MNPLISAQTLLEAEHRIKTLVAIAPSIIEEYAVHAKLKREKFKALTREGFTEEQAMQIIVNGGESLNL